MSRSGQSGDDGYEYEKMEKPVLIEHLRAYSYAYHQTVTELQAEKTENFILRRKLGEK